MNVRYLITSESLYNSSIAVSFSMVPAEEDSSLSRNRPPSSSSSSSLMMRMAIRMSRARWYSFLRRVFHYQNGSSTSDLGSNPFNSLTWMMMECITLTIQILITAYTLSVSKGETPIWPMRIWVSAYAFACFLSLMLLCCRYFVLHHRDVFSAPSHTQHHTNNIIEESRSLRVMEKCVELFFAIWFVMGNVWALDSRFGSFHRAPKLHVLCIVLLAWNAVTYSLPFILFVLLCCCVPLFSSLLGYNINMPSIHRGASDHRLSTLPTWKYNNIQSTNSALENDECCICLASYREKEEIRQLPCFHTFHLKCVDQWLRIISSCPLCKKELER